MIMSKETIKKTLEEYVVSVTFNKQDGSERVMLCTLKPDLVQEYIKKTDKTREQNEDVCPVFDLEKQEWRSFRYDSIKHFDKV